jgi:hypothetical protein
MEEEGYQQDDVDEIPLEGESSDVDSHVWNQKYVCQVPCYADAELPE